MQSRAFERVVVDLAVSCTFEGKSVQAQLYNLSVDGCMVDIPDLVLRGGEVLTIRLVDEFEKRGEVVWERAGSVGVRFFECLHPAWIQHLGFKYPAPRFGEQKPFDRFGKTIPDLPSPFKESGL